MKSSTHGLSLIHSQENGQKGFTLIELIMVIVLLGLLAVVAVPKYQDMKTDAAEAQADGVFGAAQGLPPSTLPTTWSTKPAFL